MALKTIEIGAVNPFTLFGDGSVSAPSIAFINDRNTGIYRIGEDILGIAAGGVEQVRVGSATLVVNEDGTDTDFRIESDTNAQIFHVDAGLFTGVGAVGLGAVAGNLAAVVIDPPAFTAAANTNIARLRLSSTAAITVPTGTTTIACTLFLAEPNLVATGTITNAVTLYIAGAPTEGTNNYALWVDAGRTRIDEALNLTNFIDTGLSGTLHIAGNVSPAAEWSTIFINGNTFTFSANIANERWLFLDAPTLAGDVAGRTITNAATLYITAAPVQGTNMTISNSYAIWSDAGTNRFDGTVQHGLAGTITGVATFGGATSGTVTLTVAAAAGTWTMTLPTAVGAAGQQLTDAAGDGITSWAAAGSLREFKNILGVLSPAIALQRILAVPIELWQYKRDGRITTGDFETVYAGVVADKAPWSMHFGGTIFDPMSAFGHAAAAIQALHAEIANLKQELSLLRT